MRLRKKKMSSALALGVVCLISVFLVKPVIIVDVTGASSRRVQVEGWTQTDAGGPRVGLEGRSTPFRLVLKGPDVQASFTTPDEDQRFEVQAVQKWAWLPRVRVQAAGSRISIFGNGSHLGLRAR